MITARKRRRLCENACRPSASELPARTHSTMGSFMSRRVFVTGGAGFIGSHYVRTLLTGGYPAFAGADLELVTVYDKLTYAGNLANLAPVADDPRYRFVQGDICDPAALDAALPGHDIVVNFAAETHVDRSITGAADFVVTNVLGVQTLFEACLRANIGRVVQVS